MSSDKYQRYPEEFRRDAVERASQPGVTQTQVAMELGITASQISNWKRKFLKEDREKREYAKHESEEMHQLRKENQRLLEEMAFLKKATAYFTQQQK